VRIVNFVFEMSFLFIGLQEHTGLQLLQSVNRSGFLDRRLVDNVSVLLQIFKIFIIFYFYYRIWWLCAGVLVCCCQTCMRSSEAAILFWARGMNQVSFLINFCTF